MFRHHPFTRFGAMLLVLALLSNSVLPVAHAQSTTPLYLPIITNGNAAPQTDLVFRTRITVQTPAQWRDLQRMEVVILEQEANAATVLVDDLQLEDLARLRYNPEATNALATMAAHDSTLQAAVADLLQQAAVLGKQIQATEVQGSEATLTAARAELRTYLQTLEATQLEAIAQAASVDTDNDGLTDDSEFFWCTVPTRADTDYDLTNDGAEVAALRDWMNNKLSGPPSTNKPFLRWPRQLTDCYDDDYDSVPDLAELYHLGLRAPWESTDNDKFDDGQELFGITDCPGGDASCGYGDLPRSSDTGYVGSTMPGWVKAPGSHPLVAAYPVPEVDVVESSFVVQTVTEIIAGHTIAKGTEKAYTTSKTEGTSKSETDTTTWNEWEENSVTSPAGSLLAAQTESPDGPLPPGYAQQNCPSLAGTPYHLDKICVAGVTVVNMSYDLCVGEKQDFSLEQCKRGVQKKAQTVKDAANKVKNTTQSAWDGFRGWGAKVVDNARYLKNQAVDLAGKTADWAQNNFKLNSCSVGLPLGVSCEFNFTQSTNDPSGGNIDRQKYSGAYQDGVNGTQANQLQETQNGGMMASYFPLGYPSLYPVPTSTETHGRSWGGARSTTSTIYEEHTVANTEAFSSEESWENATATDSAHAADLTFQYKIRNSGTEYAREIGNLAFNIYVGDQQICTYVLAIGQCGIVADAINFRNVMPNEEQALTSGRIPLSLQELKAIDLGEPIRVTVADLTYGVDEVFYQKAANGGVLISIEDGNDDGDENVDVYLIPTWKASENVVQVLARYFPHETDATGTITAIWTPEYRTDNPAWCQAAQRPADYPSRALWCKHELSTSDWWSVYTNGLGDGSEGFQDTQAVPGSVALFRFNKDSDQDGFSDRSEAQLGTAINDASSFPYPEVLAGLHQQAAVNTIVTATLSLLNSGLYDAYGVEAVMVAPNDSITILGNTVGGSGRVRALKQVVVGSRLELQSPLPSDWLTADHAKPAVAGYYTGNEDRIYTFTVQCAAAGNCEVGKGDWQLNWIDNRGGSGQLRFDTGYLSPNFVPIAQGITVALYSGKIKPNATFMVRALKPQDTFAYRINREPYTEPLVIVSYNDPQGNHRFVLPSQAMSLTAPTANLQQFAGTMLDDVGVEIVTSQPFTVGVNSATLLVNNPSAKTLQNARLFLEVINISGTVVSEVPTQVNLPPGPTAVPVSFNTGSFNPTYRAADDYIVMAFLTDYQGNILDTAGRPLSSFQVDPLPELAADDATLSWNIGTVTQGTLLKHALALANTGFGRLYTYIPPTSGLALNTVGSRTIGAADQPLYELTLRTADLPVGAYDQTITLATSDPTQPTRSLRVYGAITAASGDTSGGVLQRPLDFAVTVPGSHSQGEWVEFTHNLGPEPLQNLHPVKVYSQDYSTLYGVGKYATSFGQGTASYDMFGDGRDGVMPSSGNLDYGQGFGIGWANGLVGSTSIHAGDIYGLWRINPGDVVLIHQTQGSDAGCWEINKAVSDFGGEATYQVANPLKCNYSTSGSNKAQIMRVPQYSTCNVTGVVTPLGGWNGSWGGIFAVMCNESLQISGSISATGLGFRGGTYKAGRGGRNGQGEGQRGDWNNASPNTNSNSGGGGRQESGDKKFDYGGGGGGGNATNGGNAQYQGALGGTSSGLPDLTQLALGGGGGVGGGPWDGLSEAGNGGNGGGAILLFGRQVTISGAVQSNGLSGLARAGGGGAGGSILITGQTISVNNSVLAKGGNGESSYARTGYGGAGSDGRIRVEYCEFLTGTTNPPASTKKLNCHITEQVETAPYNTARLNLPESFSDGRTYQVQFGRKLDFTAAGNQVTTLRVPAGLYNSVQIDALVSGLPANATLSLDVGNDGSTEWSGAVVNNSTNVSGDLAAAFTAYWRSQNSPSGGTLDVPIKVTTTQPGQILLTNLQVSATGSRLRYVRVPVANYTRFLLDFTAGNGGTVALDLGDNGSIDWSTPLAAPRQLTENLNDELNAYLAGKSGNVYVPVRFYLAPLHPITLNDYQATVASTLDLIANNITVGNGAVTAAGADSILIDAGSTATVQATLRNNSSSASGPVTAAFFATATGWGDWYIGSAFVANIAATSNVTVTIPWNTTGFSGTVPVKVVINPYQRVAETNYNNNRKETSVIVPLPPVLPAPPTNLVATMAATNRINLTWADASSNESGFKIERSPDGINGWTQIATVNAGVTTYASTGLACGKAYFYRVRAYNGNGDSAFSNVATALTRLCPPALQPLTGITQTQLTLVWSDNNSNEGGFKIERSATGATPWSQIATVGANVTTYINSGLQCGTPYYYRVRAYNGSNNSAYSAIVNATTTICAPAAPTLLAATAISATQINLSWTDASSNESGFKVERSPDGVNGWTLRTTVGANVTSLADSGLACATTYHYRVRATNAGGDSAASNVANATTPACLPDLIFADSFESGNLLAWSSRAIGGGDLRVNGAAKLVGNWGMEANINDAIAMFVTDDRPNAETRYRARFYFDPNSITMTSGDAHFIFYGFHNTAVVLRVEFRRLNSSYQVRVATLNDAPTTGAATWRTTSYVTISDAPHSLEIDWQAATAPGANNGALSFWIDGGQRPGLTSIDNDTRRIDRVRLGSIAGIDVGTRGAYYFDAFESRRRSYIGPVAGSALAAEVIAPAEPLTTTTGSSVATANLSAETATTLTADVGGLGATVTFPASASQEALIAQLILTDTQTAPDGYALLGEMMAVQSSAPVTQPVTVSVHYGLMAATVTPTATLTLQRWNGDASQWEVLPAQVNAEAQTVTAAINGPAIFALWQQEIEQTGKESSEQMEGGGYFLYLPLVEE